MYIWLIIALFCTPIFIKSAAGAEEIQEPIYTKNQTILFFIDYHKMGDPKIIKTFLEALNSVNVPIVTTVTVLRLWQAPLIKQNWKIYKIDQTYYLLLPRSALTSGSSFTDDEQLVSLYGLGLSNCVEYTEKQERSDPKFVQMVAEAGRAPVAIEEVVKKIFIHQNKFRYSVFIVGHGLLGTQICGMPIENFKKFLNELEKTALIRALFYVSCFGAGYNSQLLYKDLALAASNVEQGASNPNFPVITAALTDSPVAVRSLPDSLKEIDFKAFVVATNCCDVIDYREAARALNPNASIHIGNIAQIRYPGLPWFSVVDCTKVFPLTRVMAMTKKQPVTVTKNATCAIKDDKSPLAVLIYSQAVPFELKVELSPFPSFVSLLGLHRDPKNPQNVSAPAVFIKKIQAQKFLLQDVLKSFYIYHLQPNKRFLLDEIEARFSDKSINPELFTKIEINSSSYQIEGTFLYKEKEYSFSSPKIKYGEFSFKPEAISLIEKGQKDAARLKNFELVKSACLKSIPSSELLVKFIKGHTPFKQRFLDLVKKEDPQELYAFMQELKKEGSKEEVESLSKDLLRSITKSKTLTQVQTQSLHILIETVKKLFPEGFNGATETFNDPVLKMLGLFEGADIIDPLSKRIALAKKEGKKEEETILSALYQTLMKHGAHESGLQFFIQSQLRRFI